MNLLADSAATPLGSSLAPSVVVCASVGDGEEQRGKAVSAAPCRAIGHGGDTQLDVQQTFRLCVHDSVTQRLTLRALLLTKLLKDEFSEIGSASLDLKDLRVGVTHTETVRLNSGRGLPAVLHASLTYQLLGARVV